MVYIVIVIGILMLRVLLGFGSTWDVPDLELVMGDPNTLPPLRDRGALLGQGGAVKGEAPVGPCPLVRLMRIRV